MAPAPDLPPNLDLPPILDGAASAPLLAQLLRHRGTDIEIDAASVSRVGAQCLQVLVAAQQTWRADGKALRLINVSDACRDALAITGTGRLLGTEE